MYGRVAYPCRSPRSLDNLINLVSPSLPAFFAAATKFLLCVPSILAPLRFARLFTPFLPLSLSPFYFRSTTTVSFFPRRLFVPRITGSMDPSPEGIVIESVDGDGGTRIAIQAGVTIPNSFDIGRVRLPRNDERATMAMRLRFFVARSLGSPDALFRTVRTDRLIDVPIYRPNEVTE